MGLGGATFTLIGCVVGGSIFVLPGEIAATAGPAVILSYVIASGFAMLSCVHAIQISNVFPTSGANFVSATRVLSPIWGFFLMWMLLPSMSLSVAPLLYGLADYAAKIMPELSGHRHAIAGFTLVALYLLNISGVKATVRAQIVMVMVFVLVLQGFGVIALLHVEPDQFTPFNPNGMGAVGAGIVAAFFSFSGFNMIISLGGEIKDPRKNVPLSVGFSFLAVLVLYLSVVAAVVGVVPWDDPAITRAAVAEATERILPAPYVGVIAVAAILAILTSINALLLAGSREIYMLAKSRVLPRPLDYVSQTHDEPVGAITLLSVLIGLSLLWEHSFMQYAMLVVVLGSVGGLIGAVTLMAIPYRVPDLYDKAEIRLPKTALIGIGIVSMIVSMTVITLGLNAMQLPVIEFVIYLAVGAAYYYFRAWQLKNEGVELRHVLRSGLYDDSDQAKVDG